jgi:hypothetical protein
MNKQKTYNTIGKFGGALGGVADLVAINTTDDEVRKTAQYTGAALKGIGTVAQNAKSKNKDNNMDQVNFDDIARENMVRTHQNMPTTNTREVVNYNVDNTPKTKAEYADDTVIEVPNPYTDLKVAPNNKMSTYRNGVNKRDKKRYV